VTKIIPLAVVNLVTPKAGELLFNQPGSAIHAYTKVAFTLEMFLAKIPKTRTVLTPNYLINLLLATLCDATLRESFLFLLNCPNLETVCHMLLLLSVSQKKLCQCT